MADTALFCILSATQVAIILAMTLVEKHQMSIAAANTEDRYKFMEI